jgi:hypothetical protein
LCFGFVQITRTTPLRRITLQLSQRGLTDADTFIVSPSVTAIATQRVIRASLLKTADSRSRFAITPCSLSRGERRRAFRPSPRMHTETHAKSAGAPQDT